MQITGLWTRGSGEANSQAVFALMRVMSARNANEAKQYGRQLRELKAESLTASRARVLSNFALDDAKKEDWPKAIDRLREAIEVCGECHVRTQLHTNLGLIMAQSSDNAGAITELAIAHELDPDDRDIEYALELLRKRIPRSGP
jgi:tetratricopeptide (TPR) repeat protein